MRKYKQGFFKPKNPEKYKGDVNNIVYRSGWELKVLREFDNNPQVLKYSSEEIIIPYISPKDNRYHRYFVDFWVKTVAGETLIEVKPFSETQPPKKKKYKRKKVFVEEVLTYAINQAKWEAAEKFCKNKGWNFRIMTEHEILGKPKKVK